MVGGVGEEAVRLNKYSKGRCMLKVNQEIVLPSYPSNHPDTGVRSP